MKRPQFPKDFLWGASASAYQVEGGLRNQWSEWEKANAKRLGLESPKKLAWLPHQERIASDLSDPGNYISGKGVEHYERYEADFDLLKKLNMNAYRFGIEWSRLEPREGDWDESAIEHYRSYIRSLKRRGIEPIPTLWHWTLPLWFSDKGGFEKKSNIKYFERYARKIADEFAGELTYILTINEPNVYAGFSYVTGDWPPQRKRPVLGLTVYKNLVRAHRSAYGVLKASNPRLMVSIAHSLGEIRPKNSRNPLNRLVVRLAMYVWNWWFLDRIKNHSDFVGVNFYITEYRDWLGRTRNPAHPVNDLGWYMEPKGLAHLLERTWRRYRKPLIITENGLADSSDSQREWWLSETFTAMREALGGGVNLIGYLHWSLLDNFEWTYGWWPKFGLVAVDREHGMKRSVRPSARWFADRIKDSGQD
jgi:beta-glucosidase